MGYPIEVFVDRDRAEQLTCGICFDVLESAVSVCEEGHRYCRGCVADLERCPECRVDMGLAHRARDVNLEIAAMQARCEPEDVAGPRCPWQGPLGERQAHCASCPTVMLRRQVVDLRGQLQAAQAAQAQARAARARLEQARADQDRVAQALVRALPPPNVEQDGADITLFILMMTGRRLHLRCRATSTVAELKLIINARSEHALEQMYLVRGGGGPLTNDAATLQDAGCVDFSEVMLLLPIHDHSRERLRLQAAAIRAQAAVAR